MAPVDGDRTRLSVSVHVEVRGLLRLLSPFLARMANRNGSTTVANVKRILEGRGPAAQR